MIRLKAILFFVLLPLLSSNGASLLEEHFNYPNGNLGSSGVGNTVWTAGDSPSAAIAVNTNAALNHAGLFGATGSGVVFSGGTFKKIAAPFTSQSGAGTVVYISFLLNVQTAGSGAKLVAYLQNANSASSSPPLGIFLNGTTLGLAKSGSTPPVTTTLSAGTHLIVARYNFLAGNDSVDLWLDPATLGTNGTPSPTLSTTNSGDATALGHVFLNHAVNQTVWLDELRVGTSWADVTPTDGSSPPPTTTQPRFTEVFTSPTGLVMRGTNGDANGTFVLLGSTNPALSPALWTEVSSNVFNGSGQFDLTNPVSPGFTHQFFRIRSGSSSNPPSPVAPTIVTQPTNQTVNAGFPVTFVASATGTSPLSYQWYFNASSAISGATNASHTISAATTNDAGNYSVVVTNIAGNATSSNATLTVNVPPPTPPSITSQPQSQTVTAGATVNFSVTATGSGPLSYQWYFNTNSALTGRTNATLTLNGVSTNDSGAYSVSITNTAGTTNSTFAMLTVNEPDTNSIDFSHVGFAANGITLTGGAAGPTVYVGSEAELQTYSDVNPPYTIIITQSFNLTSMDTHIRNNKTLIGSNNVVLSGGGLYLYDATNVIIRNLTITGSPEDGIGLHYSEHVWIDHCTITDSGDGAIDITQESDNITISWCHIYYSSPSLEHRLASLIASSDADSGTYRVTYHNNWFGTNCQERLPSVRFGRAHIFNNYYNAPGNNYCVRTRKDAECLVENNFFQSVKNPWEQYITSGSHVQGKLSASGNSVPFLGTANGVIWTGSVTNGDGTIRVMIPGTDSVFAPPYSYTLRNVGDVPGVVTGNAGANAGPFAP